MTVQSSPRIGSGTVPLGLALLAICATLLPGCRDGAPREDLAAPPPRPNVVLIVVDTLRADRLPFYGAPRDTAPFLDRLARESRVYENAYSPSSWTLPAMASVFTAVHPFQHGVVSLEGLELEEGEEPVPVNCIPAELQTLPELLREHGYRTFGVASNLLLTEAVGFGRGFDRFVTLDDEPADRVNAQLLLWREEILRSEPFFLYLHYFDPHDTWHAREPWLVPYRTPRDAGWPEATIRRDDTAHDWIDWIVGRVEPQPPDWVERSASELPDGELDRLFAWIKSAYDSEIGFVDRQIGELFDRLGLDDAVVLFLSDHGEEFFEHGALTHGFNLHVETVRVPLLLRLPGGRDPGRVSEPVSTLDVVPTLRRLLGLPSSNQDEGVDLLTAEPTRAVHGMLDSKAGFEVDDDLRALSVSGLRLVIDGRGRAALYDTREDPLERRDVAADSPGTVAELRHRLGELEASATTYSRATCMPEAPDEKMLERLRAIGYLGETADG